MADNVTLPGTGSVVAADEIGGLVYQRVKVSVGADGAATDLAPGQATMASSVPVVVASNQSAVPVSDNGGSLTVDGTVTVAGAAADDAAASGNPVAVAAVYQATADNVDDGDIGRLRMTQRRSLLTAADFHSVTLDASSVAGADDIVVATSFGSYVAPTVAFFNGADAGFGASARYIKIPMAPAGWREAALQFKNELGVSVTLSVIAMIDTNAGMYYPIYSASVAHNGVAALRPQAGGTGTSAWASVPALSDIAHYLLIEITPASDPSSGLMRLVVARRSL